MKMARFPKAEAEIVALSLAMVDGFTDNAAVYPAPPVDVATLTTLYGLYSNARNDMIAAQASAEQATVDKDIALDELVDAMKSDLRYAENTVGFDDEQLKLIGWGGRSPRTALELPGQPRTLEAIRQGDNWVYLDWKKPADGGKPTAYKITRRERPEGPWEDIATALITEATLVDQPKGKELECRIVAVNKTGDSEPSNTVMVVL